MRRIHRMPFGTQVVETGVGFRLWAPTARKVALVLGDAPPVSLDRDDDGWCRITLHEARAGDDYHFLIDGHLAVPDPCSRYQPDDAHGPSRVIDPTAYEWGDADWRGRPWHEAVIYELHVGSFTPEGTFRALEDKLDHLRDLGVTAVELLPVADFPGWRNWGYDGVLPFAPDSAYGTPDDLKRLVDRAHARGLMIFLDVVYNHFGPSGNYLHAYAERFFTDKHATPWGKAINFDDSGRDIVRDYFIHNALYWLEEFHFDGLRFDAVHAIRDDSKRHFLTDLAERVRAALPDRQVHLVLENDANEARRLAPGLFDAQWNDDAHHVWHVLLTGEADGYYADYADDPAGRLTRVLTGGFDYRGEPSRHRDGERRGEPSAHLPPTAVVDFLQNHDQIGNRAFGDRLTILANAEKLSVARAVLLLSPHVPLLFMGEEWGAETPFLFFCDFSGEPDLAKAVREGRRNEFAGFSSFGADGTEIPDPNGVEAFSASALDWDEPRRTTQAAILAETRDLLALRARHIVPLLASEWRGASGSAARGLVDVTWAFAAGRLRLVLNLGDGEADMPQMEAHSVIWSNLADSSRILEPWQACLHLEPAK